MKIPSGKFFAPPLVGGSFKVFPGGKIFGAYPSREFDEIFPGGKFFGKGVQKFSKGFLGSGTGTKGQEQKVGV